MAPRSRPLPSSRGVDDYPYDPAARIDELDGLDRLRAVADRKHADHLYTLYVQAERNTAAVAAERPQTGVTVSAIARVGARALAGEFGPDARELAEYLLLDHNGRQREDQVALRAFAIGLRKLREAT